MFETKIETDPYLDKLEAKDPALYQELLLEFLKYPLTTASIARHGTTPKSILAKLVQGKSIPWNEVLIHPNCPEDVLNQKLNSTVETDRISISQNPVLTEDQIRMLAVGASDTVLVWICRRPDCPSDILESSFSICEQQWNNVVAEVETYSEANNPSVLFDDDDVFGELIESAYYEFDESLAEAIAGNRNTPKEVFKKLLQMNPKNELLTGGSLGSTLMENPSVSKMDKAFLALQGISKKKSSNEQTFSAIEYGGLPSSLAFEIPGFPIKYLEALNEVGHPFALLFPSLRVTSNTYSFNTSVDGWVKHETIYRTLWPELKERDDVVFGYWRSSYDGDSFYFSCKEVDFEHDFSRGSRTYNSMSYPFIERSWAELDEDMDIEMAIENFQNRDLIELYDYCEEGEYDLILASIVSTFSSQVESDELPQYILTKKGEEFVCEQAESFFEDDRDVKIEIIPEKALPYSWRALSDEKKLIITTLIIDGYKEKVDDKYQYAEHFLTCIALNLSTPPEVKALLATVDSKVVKQALEVPHA